MSKRIIYVALMVLVLTILVIILALLQMKKPTVSIEKPPPLIRQPSPPPLQRQPPQQPSSYQQIGILTSDETDKKPIILPLFGRKIRNDRWQYYTATDKANMLRIPLRVGNRECEDVVGCGEIYSGDVLIVDIYQGRLFTATIYRIDAPHYFADVY